MTRGERWAAGLFAGALVASATAPAHAASLHDAVDAALRAPTLARAHVGLLVVDAASGATLYARQAGDDFVPASTLKLIVGSAALARLGPAFTFATTVAAGASIGSGTLSGNLYLRGGGDVQLSDGDLEQAATAVAAAGVTHVSGAVVADATRYDAPRYPPGWQIDDIPYEYAAIPSALGLNLNVAHVRVLPGDAPGAPTTLQADPQSDALTLENAAVTGPPGSPDTTDLARPWDRPNTVVITGRYPLGAPPSDDLTPALPDPSRFAADRFLRALTTHGVTVDGGLAAGTTPPGAPVLWTHQSKPLRALLRDFWPPSTNLLGEQLLEELGVAAPSAAGDTRARGLAAERTWLRSIGVDPSTLTLADGSGLSSYDRVTPHALAGVLLADWRGPERATVLAALPVAGTSGTLSDLFGQAPLRGAIVAKTGSMNHARLLAGYARTHRDRTRVFVLMIDEWTDPSPAAERALDAARAQILTALIEE